jgi:bifunctional non-homologous end joining protein LigD
MKRLSDTTEALGARFVEPMLCLAVEKLPEGPAWQYEVKLDGYRAIGVRTKAGVELWSRNKRDFSRRFREVTRSLEALPADSVLDGEIVAVSDDGKPSFSALQNFEDGAAAIVFYVFDLPILAGADLRNEPLATRREMLRDQIPRLPDTIRFSETFNVTAAEMTAAVRSNGTRRRRRETRRRRVQAGRSVRFVGQSTGESRPGIRDWWIPARFFYLRCDSDRVL